MSDQSNEPEGWAVRQRVGMLAAVGTVATLVVLLIGAGMVYDRTLRPKTYQHHVPFPAPGLETLIHDGVKDPRAAAPSTTPDAGVAAAKRRILSNGLAGWERRP